VPRIEIRSRVQAEEARREARRLAQELGFGPHDAETVVLATVELATNLLRYAVAGALVLSQVEATEGGWGVEIESVDGGPGIADTARALEDGFSTGAGLGGGLPSVRRLMDEFTITSSPNGTRVVVRKWATRR
jgi:serine/threonine-protein kinase RsbT